MSVSYVASLYSYCNKKGKGKNTPFYFIWFCFILFYLQLHNFHFIFFLHGTHRKCPWKIFNKQS